jgi:uncharacterized membrane protein YfcA
MFAAAMLAVIYVGDRIHMQINETTLRRFACATLVLCGTLLWLK